jgi:crotonobetainyl-CoA:carnitine CoA-transferase CaiB-like acyl-CoA transferase
VPRSAIQIIAIRKLPRRLDHAVARDETPASITRAPQFAEHTDEILRELGRTDDELIELKLAGAVA